jgi:RNA polymerase sigma factor (sigma-70 family)
VHPDTDHGVISFTDAWKQHAAELRQRCLTWTGGNPWDADEAISRTACIIFLKLPSQTQSISDLRAWFLRLTYNVCMDLHRERKRRCEQRLDETLETVPSAAVRVTGMEGGNPERHYLDAELREYLHGRILELPSKLRDALQLRMQQHSYPEIASHLGINEAAVRKRVQLARQALRRDLMDYSEGHRPRSGASRRAGRRVPSLETKPVLQRR